MAIGFMSMPTAPQWILTVGVVALSWVAPKMRRAEPHIGEAAHIGEATEPLHPLGSAGAVWPGARP
jgi:hypothetical protein